MLFTFCTNSLGDNVECLSFRRGINCFLVIWLDHIIWSNHLRKILVVMGDWFYELLTFYKVNLVKLKLDIFFIF